ncbi:hypothetical protein SCUP234_05781 [Seiridium cupressi]
MLSTEEYELKASDFLTILSNNVYVKQGDPSKSDRNAIFSPQTSLWNDWSNANICSRQLERLTVQKIQWDVQSSYFHDITPPIGISNPVAALLYHPGRLSRLRSAILSKQAATEKQWFWGAFESDGERLELRLGQMLRHRNNQSKILKTFVQNLNLSQ